MASCLLYKFPEDKNLRVAMASNKTVCVCVLLRRKSRQADQHCTHCYYRAGRTTQKST